MSSMELLDLDFMMKWLEHILIHIFSNIIVYFMMMHIYMDALLICIWVNWRLMVFLSQHLVHLMLEELHLTLRWIDLWWENIFVSSHIICYMLMSLSFMDLWVRLLWVILSLLVFCARYLVRFWWWFFIHSLDERTHGWLYWCTLYILEHNYGTWDPHICHWSRF